MGYPESGNNYTDELGLGTGIAELQSMRTNAMKKICLVLGFAVALSACSRSKEDAVDVPTGTDVTVEKKDGVAVSGRLVEVKADQVMLQLAAGGTRTVQRSDIASMRAVPLPTPAATPAAAPEVKKEVAPAPATGTGGQAKGAAAPLATPRDVPPDAAAAKTTADRTPEFREVTIPQGTTLPLELRTSVSSDGSNIEDAVRAKLTRAITIDGVTALPAGTSVTGHVSEVARSAKVKGRARVAFRFTQVDPPGPDESASIRTSTVAREAEGTRKQDAAKIGGGAVGGAIIGGILGGGGGAAKGAAIGCAGGTGVVLATRGKEVRLAVGTPVSVTLSAPLTLRIAMK
ncbi:hypothetical protein BH18ACI5_BH18ACI5_28790 [soil metagenome]